MFQTITSKLLLNKSYIGTKLYSLPVEINKVILEYYETGELPIGLNEKDFGPIAKSRIYHFTNVYIPAHQKESIYDDLYINNIEIVIGKYPTPNYKNGYNMPKEGYMIEMLSKDDVSYCNLDYIYWMLGYDNKTKYNNLRYKITEKDVVLSDDDSDDDSDSDDECTSKWDKMVAIRHREILITELFEKEEKVRNEIMETEHNELIFTTTCYVGYLNNTIMSTMNTKKVKKYFSRLHDCFFLNTKTPESRCYLTRTRYASIRVDDCKRQNERSLKRLYDTLTDWKFNHSELTLCTNYYPRDLYEGNAKLYFYDNREELHILVFNFVSSKLLDYLAYCYEREMYDRMNGLYDMCKETLIYHYEEIYVMPLFKEANKIMIKQYKSIRKSMLKEHKKVLEISTKKISKMNAP